MFYHGPKLRKYQNDGFTWLYYPQVCANGLEVSSKFIKLIKENSEKKCFTRAHEWCAGPGHFGFTLLHNHMTKHLVLSDISDLAVKSCAFTAMANGVEDKTTIYLIDDLAELPSHEVWDLVVSNPPWWPEVPADQTLTEDEMRMYVDYNWHVHNQLWESTDRLDNDAEIFLLEDQQNLGRLRSDIKNAGLNLEAVYSNFDTRLNNGKSCVLHITKQHAYFPVFMINFALGITAEAMI